MTNGENTKPAKKFKLTNAKPFQMNDEGKFKGKPCSGRGSFCLLGECLWEFFFSLDPRRISETDLSASSPVSASPENKKYIQVQDGPSETDLSSSIPRCGSSETDLSTSSPVTASPGEAVTGLEAERSVKIRLGPGYFFDFSGEAVTGLEVERSVSWKFLFPGEAVKAERSVSWRGGHWAGGGKIRLMESGLEVERSVSWKFEWENPQDGSFRLQPSDRLS